MYEMCISYGTFPCPWRAAPTLSLRLVAWYQGGLGSATGAKSSDVQRSANPARIAVKDAEEQR